MGPNDDIEHFLATFERIAKQQEWLETVWATQLAGLLTGKALAAYAAITGDEAQDYDRVKEAVLHRYDVNKETLRHRFRQGKKRPEESYRAWVCRTADDFDRWMKGQEMSVREVVTMERILLGVPAEMAVWLKEKKSESLELLGRPADDYALARKSESAKAARLPAPGLKLEVYKPPSPTREEHQRAGMGSGRVQVNTRGDKRYYSCGRWGHLSYSYPN